MTFKQKVSRFIQEKNLIKDNSKILVALSGGADSVALLRVLIELGYTCEGAHCNFHLRGSESERDEMFVRGLCSELDIPLNLIHFDTSGYSSSHGISIEMAAREQRYEWFEQLRKKKQADVIAVAHHRDDSVETFLLNLSRGTGIKGLKGIMPKNGFIVRPLLEVGRADILDYLNSINQEYVTDSTNLEDIYTRNKIRLGIIPMFTQINPSFADSVIETASRLSDVAEIYMNHINNTLQKIMRQHDEDCNSAISINALLQETGCESVLFEWLSPYGFNSSQVKDIMRCLDGESGKRFYSSEWELLKDRDLLLLRRKTNLVEESVSICTKIIDVDENYQVPKDKNVAYLDADKVKNELKIRRWMSGDKFVPFGMKGFKKVRDYLRDRKFSVFQKENVYVVLSGDDIIWLVGERTDNRFKVDSTTTRVLIISVCKL